MRFNFGYMYQAIADRAEDWGEDKACKTVQLIIEMGRAQDAESSNIISVIEEYIDWELNDTSLDYYIERMDDETS